MKQSTSDFIELINMVQSNYDDLNELDWQEYCGDLIGKFEALTNDERSLVRAIIANMCPELMDIDDLFSK